MTKMKRFAPLAVGLAGIALVMGAASPSNAAPDDTNRKARGALSKSSPAFQQYLNTGKGDGVEIPAASSGKIRIKGSKGQSIGLGLPFAGKNAPAQDFGSGLTSYNNGNGSSTVPVPQQDNSVAVHTVLESASAPSEYAYPVELPRGAKMKVLEDGSVMITGSNNKFLGGFAKPWAKDAAGKSLPTHYEVKASSLVQHVDHSQAGLVYPVVADPWMGFELISGNPWQTYTSKGSIINLNPTGWGRQFNGPVTHTAHVDELRSKLSRALGINLIPTIQEQYLCHVVGNVFEPGTYNLETWRRTVPWYNQLNLTDRCNP